MWLGVGSCRCSVIPAEGGSTAERPPPPLLPQPETQVKGAVTSGQTHRAPAETRDRKYPGGIPEVTVSSRLPVERSQGGSGVRDV